MEGDAAKRSDSEVRIKNCYGRVECLGEGVDKWREMYVFRAGNLSWQNQLLRKDFGFWLGCGLLGWRKFNGEKHEIIWCGGVRKYI